MLEWKSPWKHPTTVAMFAGQIYSMKFSPMGSLSHSLLLYVFACVAHGYIILYDILT